MNNNIENNNNNNNNDNNKTNYNYNYNDSETKDSSKSSNNNKNNSNGKVGSKLAQAVSLRRGVESWIVRPTTEDVLENLEEFFLGHDLDKPITETTETTETPETPVIPVTPQNITPQQETETLSKVIKEKSDGDDSHRNEEGNGGGAKLTRFKSIRSAAQEAHQREIRERY
jgi:hypothetical protein